MAALEDFENTLKEVVGAKRLSASKMNRLTEIAMKSLEDDTKLVAILYRTHNSLPSSAKVSSLYAFDALARAARSLVNKRGITGDVNLAKGNPATFLLKIEGVLDGLFRDMVSLNSSEAKEKTKKVHDIWVKSNAFPPAVLARLGDILSDVQKEIAVNPTPPTGPPATTQVPTIITTSQPAAHVSDPVPDVQATLLALLGQAAQGQGQPPSQTPPNLDQQLQQPQLALLQQLALTAKLANGSTPPPQTPPFTDKITSPAVIPAQEPLHPSSRPAQTGVSTLQGMDGTPVMGTQIAREINATFVTNDTCVVVFAVAFVVVAGGMITTAMIASDLAIKTGTLLLHVQDTAARAARIDMKSDEIVRPYSPPRRPSNDRNPGHQPQLPTPPTSTHGKDEFGRDIRASSASPSRSTSVEDTQTLAPMDSSVDPTTGAAPDNHIPVSDQLPLVAASTTAQSTETHTPSPASQQQSGLDQFDINAFDATAPSSWEGLGNMWQTTHGYPPSQEELMHFVMRETVAATGTADGGFNGVQGGQWQQGNGEEHGSHTGDWQGRGRGNYTGGSHGNYRNGANVAEQSDATIVLNGDVADNGQSMVQDGHDEQHDSAGGSCGGRMQRVGDKWMFVKDVESA
ncbi:hypothetical protein JVT61DRAFT_278 [Boletus reticuloceps]|uniref:CID domain-containing protein n=1 Tax=Boletus reticuloceps TaxID=495285 RepID=A0A8I2Z2W9_9AGAM|nr:hypothetical protein JVT61DRAFT_278 [Boletus reticuloceps]